MLRQAVCALDGVYDDSQDSANNVFFEVPPGTGVGLPLFLDRAEEPFANLQLSYFPARCPELAPRSRLCSVDMRRSCRFDSRDCSLSSWSEWGNCAPSCGFGSHVRNRNVLVPSVGSGVACQSTCVLATCGSPNATAPLHRLQPDLSLHLQR